MSQLSLQLVASARSAPEAPREASVPPLRGVDAGQDSGGGRGGVPPRTAAIDRLRALVGARGRVGVVPSPPEPGAEVPSLLHGHLSTGIAGLDAWLRGWPQLAPIELVGAPGGGRLALLIPLLERLTQAGRSVVLVDPLHQVHPPGLGQVDLTRVVLVRPPGERAGWSAEQVARSGAVNALVVIDAPAFGRAGVRFARAAEAGGMAVFVLADRPDAELPAALRLEVAGWEEDRVRVRCTRSRDGRNVGERWITPSEAPPDRAPIPVVRAERARRFQLGVG